MLSLVFFVLLDDDGGGGDVWGATAVVNVVVLAFCGGPTPNDKGQAGPDVQAL